MPIWYSYEPGGELRVVTARTSRKAQLNAPFWEPAPGKDHREYVRPEGGMRMHATGTIVSTEWLATHLHESNLRLVDATWYVLHPVGLASTHVGQARSHQDARAEFVEAHIPGAVFFDIEKIADTDSSLPLMLPSPEKYGKLVGALGIGNDDLVVAYGTFHLMASARVWWMFRAMGHDRVVVLDGGFPKWRAEGRPVERGTATPQPRVFTALFRKNLVADLERLRDNLKCRREQVVDARSPGRFMGTEPERRPGLRGGHIPRSLNLPYEELFRSEDGTLLPTTELQGVFEKAGLDLRRPVITTCGAGGSNPVLALALHVVGSREVLVYDGSWAEWGGRDDTPVEL